MNINFKDETDMQTFIVKSDIYNTELGIYAFLYNEEGAICTYNLTLEEAQGLQKRIRENALDYWSDLLGLGGIIYDDWYSFCSEHYGNPNWIRTEDVRKVVAA